MPSARCSIRRYSNSTVFSPATVRLIPIIVAPAACIQCSSICLLPPGAVCQSPEIHEMSASVGVSVEALTVANNINRITNAHGFILDLLENRNKTLNTTSQEEGL